MCDLCNCNIQDVSLTIVTSLILQCYFITNLTAKPLKTKLQNSLYALVLALLPNVNFSQAPNLGTAANFVLFSTNGAVSNTGISQITGHVGTNNGSSTAFGNVNGVMHNQDGASAQCAADLLAAYNQLNASVATFFPAPLLGNGASLNAGIYSIGSAATLNLELVLNAQGDPNAVFIFKIQGPLSTNAGSRVKLINGALACNVFWKVEGLVTMAPGSHMKGTIIANNAAINMNSGDTLEGRALVTAGAITVDGLFAYTPIGCGSPVLNGAGCYGVFSSNGAVTNSGITAVTGDVGSNVGLATGFNTLSVSGKVHPIPDGSTAQCALDLAGAYNYLNTLPVDIELLYPAQFGKGLVLTPHTYLLDAATVFTDSLYLNALGNADAVFVIKINGALTTGTYAKVKLINGAQAKNVYWKIEGAVNLNNYSIFRGTIICNNGALASVNTGVVIDGRMLTTNGALTTNATTIIATMIPSNCLSLDLKESTTEKNTVSLYPNPFSSTVNLMINNYSNQKLFTLMVYTSVGRTILSSSITSELTTINMEEFPTGLYYYTIMDHNLNVQSGKIISH